MKRLNLLLCTIAIAGLSFTSCSSDDNNDGINNDVQIAGTYNLVEVRTAQATDFNEDGTSHVNQMEETDCYDGSKMVFNADNTFSFVKRYVLVDTQQGTSACTETQVAGTWSLYAGTGTTAILRATYQNANGNDVTIQVNKEGNKITHYEMFGQYPDRNSEGGAIYRNGEVTWIFQK